jgi:hypothetical protein
LEKPYSEKFPSHRKEAQDTAVGNKTFATYIIALFYVEFKWVYSFSTFQPKARLQRIDITLYAQPGFNNPEFDGPTDGIIIPLEKSCSSIKQK